jgi:hypothetical protein
MAETAHRCLNIGGEQCATLEQEAGVTVLNCEWKAELAVPGPELALEVGGPGAVGLRQNGRGRTGVSTSAPRFGGLDTALSDEDPVHGIDAGCDLDIGIIDQFLADLAGPPASVVANLVYTCDDGRRGGVSAGGGAVRAVLEAVEPLGPIPLEPEMAGRPADVVAPAELGVREVGELRLDDEAGALFLHGGGPPGHRTLPVEGALRLRGEL